MAYTYSKLASYTVGSGGITSVVFSAIPQNYTDLILKCSTRSTRATGTNSSIYLQINTISTGYTYREIHGQVTTVASSNGSGSTGNWGITSQSTNTASVFGNAEFYIPNYTSANYKSISADYTQEDNTTSGWVGLTAGLLSNTDPISSITATTDGDYVQYSTFTLYGVKAEV